MGLWWLPGQVLLMSTSDQDVHVKRIPWDRLSLQLRDAVVWPAGCHVRKKAPSAEAQEVTYAVNKQIFFGI